MKNSSGRTTSSTRTRTVSATIVASDSDTESESEESLDRKSNTNSNNNKVGFNRSVRNMVTGSSHALGEQVQFARRQNQNTDLPTIYDDQDGSCVSDNTFQYRPDKTTGTVDSSVASENTFKYRRDGPDAAAAETAVVAATAGISRGISRSSSSKRKKKLSKISSMYDVDGDGELDEVEQAMRAFDKDGDGQLDTAEVYRIVQEQMKSQRDVGMYRKVAAGLLCLVAILALSNFGTSWATAILSSDTTADSESGTIQSKATGDVMGLQNAAYTLELGELTDEEFEERRKLVNAEMAEDPNHQDHVHRRLGKKNKNNACTCSKIAYDHNKIKHEDLDDLIKKCDGANTVNIKRKFKNDKDGREDEDFDTICGPKTQVVKKGKEKKNKHKTKVKVVDQQVSFRTKGGDGRNKDISFDCPRGKWCYPSGGALLQQESHPCRLERDYQGASECDEDLVCYHPSGDTRGNGVCTRLQMYARNNQVCRVDLGVNACQSGGTCQRVVQRSTSDQVCNVSFGQNACVTGYACRGANGIDIGDVGIGYCLLQSRSSHSGGNGNGNNGNVNSGNSGWYKSYIPDANGQCVNDGDAKPGDPTYGTARECCEQQLPWMSNQQCAPTYYG